MTPDLSDLWQPTSYVLVVEERTCGCGATYTSPNHRPQLQMRQLRTGATRLVSLSPNEHPPQHLPRAVHRCVTELDVCPSCFLTAARQDGLFPVSKYEKPPRPSREKLDPNAPKSITIDDFIDWSEN